MVNHGTYSHNGLAGMDAPMDIGNPNELNFDNATLQQPPSQQQSQQGQLGAW